MNSNRYLHRAMRAVCALGLVALASCITNGSKLHDYDVSDIRPPANKFAIAYSTSYGNYSAWSGSQVGVGIGGGSKLSKSAQRLFAETGFFSAATENFAPTGLTLLIRNYEGAEDCMWGAFLTGITLLIVPAPVTNYHHTLEAELRRDGTLLRTFKYEEEGRMWFGIVCFPAFLMGQPFKAGEAMADKFVLNLLHDLGEPSTLQIGRASCRERVS
jgi:hypothetical protein